MTKTRITFEVPQEMRRRAEARARLEGTTVTEVLQKQLEQFAAGLDEQEIPTSETKPKLGARFLNISEFDPNWRPTPEELEYSRIVLANMSKLAEEIGQRYPDVKVDAVNLVREGRREL
jgi:hypothetical protein